MKRKEYIYLWTFVQLFLFIIPILVALIYTPYQIERDAMYLENVRNRVFRPTDKVTDFKDAVVTEYDSKGKYIDIEFKQENKEIYYLINIGVALIFSVVLQFGNILWITEYPYQVDLK